MDVVRKYMNQIREGHCVRCRAEIKNEGVACTRCGEVRYCSVICLEEDRAHHKDFCDFVGVMTGRLTVLPEAEYRMHLIAQSKARLLDSEGAYISKAVISEAFGIREFFTMAIDDSAPEMSSTFPRNAFSGKSCDGASAAMTRTLKTSHQTNNYDNVNEMTRIQSLAPSEWRPFVADKIQQGHFGEGLHKLGTSYKQHSHDDGQSFGKGWWNRGPQKQKKKTSEQHSTNNASKSNRKNISKAQQREDDSFGSGWWKGRMDRPDTQKKADQQKNADSRVHANVHNHSNHSNRSDGVTNQNCDHHMNRVGTRNATNSDDFGSGWWHGKKGKKRKRTSDETDSHCKSTAAKLSSLNTDLRREAAYTDACRDVIPYKSKKTKALSDRFARVAAKIGSDLIKEEASHGRVIRISLAGVPGLWKASLGGSRVSLLLEIVASFPASKPAVLVQDVDGHTAPVLLNTSYSTEYPVPQLDHAFSVKYSKCLKPRNFILLRKVMWQELSCKRLAIVVEDMNFVDFILWELLAELG